MKFGSNALAEARNLSAARKSDRHWAKEKRGSKKEKLNPILRQPTEKKTRQQKEEGASLSETARKDENKDGKTSRRHRTRSSWGETRKLTSRLETTGEVQVRWDHVSISQQKVGEDQKLSNN